MSRNVYNKYSEVSSEYEKVNQSVQYLKYSEMMEDQVIDNQRVDHDITEIVSLFQRMLTWEDYEDYCRNRDALIEVYKFAKDDEVLTDLFPCKSIKDFTQDSEDWQYSPEIYNYRYAIIQDETALTGYIYAFELETSIVPYDFPFPEYHKYLFFITTSLSDGSIMFVNSYLA